MNRKNIKSRDSKKKPKSNRAGRGKSISRPQGRDRLSYSSSSLSSRSSKAEKLFAAMRSLQLQCTRCQWIWIPKMQRGKIIYPEVCPFCHAPTWDRTDLKPLTPWWERKPKAKYVSGTKQVPPLQQTQPILNQPRPAVYPIRSNIQSLPVSQATQTNLPASSQDAAQVAEDAQFVREIKAMCREKATALGMSEANLLTSYSQMTGGQLSFDTSSDIKSLDDFHQALALTIAGRKG